MSNSFPSLGSACVSRVGLRVSTNELFISLHRHDDAASMASRFQNERKFRHWEQLPNGGRRYVREFAGREGGTRCIKEVDANENTARFVQEIYVASGRLVADARGVCPSISAINPSKVAATPMKITRRIVADKIAEYLHGKLSQAELVDWAERAIIGSDFNESDIDLLADIVGRLGLADVAEFGLRWQDCEDFLRRLGYPQKSSFQANDQHRRFRP